MVQTVLTINQLWLSIWFLFLFLQDCVCVLFQVLCECVTRMSKDDVKNHHKQLLSLFMSALDYRSQHGQVSMFGNIFQSSSLNALKYLAIT